MNLETTSHCKLRKHCTTCRNPAETQFRASLADAYKVPHKDGHFDCPMGVPWGYRGGFLLGDFVAKVIKVVTFGLLEKRKASKRCGCKSRQAKLNKMGSHGRR